MENRTETIVNPATKSDQPKRFYTVLFFLPVAIILIAGIGVWLIWSGAWTHRSDFLSAFLIALIGAGAGSLAFWVTWRYWRGYLPQGVLAGMGIRMLITLGGILVWGVLSGKLEMRFLFLLLCLYVLGLVSETVIALKVSLKPVDAGNMGEKSLLNEK